MPAAGIAGGVDDDLDLGRRDQRERVVGDVRRAGLRARRRTSARRSARAGQPVRASDARARSGARSAMPTTWMPGVCFACARYIEPNLPAPIRPTRERAALGGALLQHAMEIHGAIASAS